MCNYSIYDVYCTNLLPSYPYFTKKVCQYFSELTNVTESYKVPIYISSLKQIEQQESRYQDFVHEAAKPLARHRDDKDLESTLKDVERDGDPMLAYIREKKRDRGELPPGEFLSNLLNNISTVQNKSL